MNFQSNHRSEPEDFSALDAWWRAANYISAGQIYLMDNPLLREPLALGHIKPRLLGHWGTTPGLNFIPAQGSSSIQELLDFSHHTMYHQLLCL